MGQQSPNFSQQRKSTLESVHQVKWSTAVIWFHFWQCSNTHEFWDLGLIGRVWSSFGFFVLVIYFDWRCWKVARLTERLSSIKIPLQLQITVRQATSSKYDPNKVLFQLFSMSHFWLCHSFPCGGKKCRSFVRMNMHTVVLQSLHASSVCEIHIDSIYMNDYGAMKTSVPRIWINCSCNVWVRTHN